MARGLLSGELRSPAVKCPRKRVRPTRAEADRLDDLPRRQRKQEAERVAYRVEGNERVLDGLLAQADQLPEIRHDARAEAAVIEHLLAERERATLAAVRISPPPYIDKELGERPSDPLKAREWDRAVRGIERYRERHGIGDRDRALGREPKDQVGRAHWRQQQRQLQESRRRLDLAQERSLTRSRSIDLGIGR